MAEGKLSVVLYDLPPFSKLEGTKVTGVDGDILNAIAEMECLTISAKSVATAANIPTVQAGRADVSIAAWYRTAARAQIVGLTDPIYTDQMAIISKDGLDSAEQLKGKTVGTVDGYLWVDDMKKLLGDSLKVYPTNLNMNQDLAAGRIDVGIDSYGSAQFNRKGDFKVTVIQPHEAIAASKEAAQIAIPVPQKNTELLGPAEEHRTPGRFERRSEDAARKRQARGDPEGQWPGRFSSGYWRGTPHQVGTADHRRCWLTPLLRP